MLAGWFTAEVGRQPWVIYGLLRTKDAVTPSLTTADVAISLAGYVLVYAVIYGFGIYYLYRSARATARARHPGPPPPRPRARWRSRASAPPARCA